MKLALAPPIPFEVDRWNEVTRPFHLTIGDVLGMADGATIECMCLDRNYMDFMVDDVTERLPYAPNRAFRNGYFLVFTKRGTEGIAGEGGIKSSSTDEPSHDPAFEFDIEYAPGHWFPLEGGQLRPDNCERQRMPAHPATRWQDFPKSTRLGWRGPAIPVRYLRHLPKLYVLGDLDDLGNDIGSGKITERNRMKRWAYPMDVRSWRSNTGGAGLHLTIGDVLDLREGDSVECVCAADSDFEGYARQGLVGTAAAPTRPGALANQGRVLTFTRTGSRGLQGEAVVRQAGNEVWRKKKFEFEVNVPYLTDLWHPVIRGRVAALTPKFADIWDKLPGYYRLGHGGGPLLPVRWLPALPDVFWFDEPRLRDEMHALKSRLAATPPPVVCGRLGTSNAGCSPASSRGRTARTRGARTRGA